MALAVAGLVVFAGAGAQPDLASIRRITIDPQAPQPEIPFIQGPGHFKAFLIGGGIGAAIDQQEAGKLFLEYMRRSDIDISRIVVESFQRVIEEDKIFALGANADATLRLKVNLYGFGVGGLFGGENRRPVMNISARLVSPGGTVVWQKTEYITNLSELTEAYTYDQLAIDPRLTVKSFGQAAVLVARQMLSELKH